jgi:hypothetical protein
MQHQMIGPEGGLEETPSAIPGGRVLRGGVYTDKHAGLRHSFEAGNIGRNAQQEKKILA